MKEPDIAGMEKYHYLQAKAPYSLDSLLPLEITDDMYAMNMTFVERYGELLAVSGIGPNKAEKYGKDILEIMNS